MLTKLTNFPKAELYSTIFVLPPTIKDPSLSRSSPIVSGRSRSSLCCRSRLVIWVQLPISLGRCSNWLWATSSVIKLQSSPITQASRIITNEHWNFILLEILWNDTIYTYIFIKIDHGIWSDLLTNQKTEALFACQSFCVFPEHAILCYGKSIII